MAKAIPAFCEADMPDDRDERMRAFFADMMKPADPQQVAAEIETTKATLAALIEEQVRLESRLAALFAQPVKDREG